jgi:hypothetical protein
MVMDAASFIEAGIPVLKSGHCASADFGSYKKGRLKEEMKYFLLCSMKDGTIGPSASIETTGGRYPILGNCCPQ